MKRVNIELRDNYIPLKDVFLDILKSRPDSKQYVGFNQNKGGLSISFFDPKNNNVSFWLTVQSKRNKLEWKYSNYFMIDYLISLRNSVTPNKNRRVAEYFGITEELYNFEPIILAIYDYRELETSGQLFDCCSRYMKCSDVKDCVNPDEELMMRCTYRQKLKQGIIFFGKNRNVQ